MTTTLAQSFDAQEAPRRHAGSTRPPAAGASTIDDAGTHSHPEPFEGTPVTHFRPPAPSGPGIDGGRTTTTPPERTTP